MPLVQYVIAHKPFQDLKLPDEKIIQVGFNGDFADLRDNTGDEISEKNGSFCELSALYWIWKNVKDQSDLSINHYRRYFRDGFHPEDLEAALHQADFLVPKKVYYKESVLDQYALESGFKKDLLLIRGYLCKSDQQAFDRVMKRGWLYQYNMMVCSRKEFDEYCSWLFPLLFKAEKEIDTSGYNDYQKRIFGFMAERLFNVYLEAQNKKVKELKVIQSELPVLEKMRLDLRNIKNRAVFKLSGNGGKE